MILLGISKHDLQIHLYIFYMFNDNKIVSCTVNAGYVLCNSITNLKIWPVYLHCSLCLWHKFPCAVRFKKGSGI